MTRRAIPSLLPHLHRVLACGHARLSDAELLECFLVQRDQAAFATLVHRHGPMVFGLCRRLLHDSSDAEDAFQATFLVLVRKARSISRPERLGNWLYGVAHRTALKARTNLARQRAREQPLIDVPVEGDLEQLVWRDVRPILDEELQRLPEKYRTPVVLCCLEGLSKVEAARQLGWPEGTLSTRLHEARQILRRRLLRRGLTLTPAVLGMALLEGVVPAAVPVPLTTATVSASSMFASGQSAALPETISALTEGVLRAMLMSKLKVISTTLVVAGMFLATIGAAITRSRAASPREETRSVDNPPAEKKPPRPPPRQTSVVEKEEAAGKIVLEPEVLQIVWSPDGSRIATSSRAKAGKFGRPDPSHSRHVRVREAHTGKELFSFAAKGPGRVVGLAFSPKGTILAVSYHLAIDKGDRLELRDAANGKVKSSMALDSRGFLQRIAFSPDGKVIAGLHIGPKGLNPDETDIDARVRFWDVATGKMIREINLDKHPAFSLAYSRDGKLLATGGVELDKTLRLWQAETGKLVWKAATGARVAGIDFSPDGKMIATGQYDGRVVLWDLPTSRVLASLPDACSRNNQPVFSPDGRLLLCTGVDVKDEKPTSKVKLWDLQSRKLLRTWSDTRSNAAFSPDSKKVLILGSDGVLRLWPITREIVRPTPKPVVEDVRATRLVDQLLAGKKTNDQVVDAVFLATLGRFPGEIEGKTALALLAKKKDRRGAIEDLLFALRNSKEHFAHLDESNRLDPRKRK